MAAGSLAPFGALTFTYFAAIGLFNPYAPLWFQSLGLSTLVIGGIVSLQSWTRVLDWTAASRLITTMGKPRCCSHRGR